MSTKPTLDEILTMFDGGIHGKGSDRGGYPTYFTEPYPLWVGERKRYAKQQLTQLIADIIGENVTQQERHWTSKVWGDVCGKDDATRHEHCICEQLNGSKAEQRQRAKERGIDL